MVDHSEFAREWIASWNAHDIDRIMSHYAHDVEYQSPFAAKLYGSSDGTLRGINAVRDYAQRGLETFPNLHFILLDVFHGVGSAVLRYQSVNNLTAAEYFYFNAEGKIARVAAHYSGET